ncbi:hypothetical protein SARC_06233 [Sphaeroforma arctica JP610]|uniref:Uncharacterized protein n=1 Tax=Sphaeroforma arctica JP610 TaxID=667725 RepID=A0A0L0FXS0_9EUKA|nr:hypothetical protein SARC_06233 [Sphaeroforma arctica JP610]KNC81444.1 hypothetical protein SARC_06233 [Sphaeroforma arctica JP610]|eukprot:XP_014155346.1 hypothetical protein SARC_06233 [Sphaeroforma arctica JP610]
MDLPAFDDEVLTKFTDLPLLSPIYLSPGQHLTPSYSPCALIGFALLGLAALQGSLLFLSVCVLCLVLCWVTFVGTWLALFSYVAHAIHSRAYLKVEHATTPGPVSMRDAELTATSDVYSERHLKGRRVSFCPTVDNDSGWDVNFIGTGDESAIKPFAGKVKKIAPDSVDEMMETSVAA